MNSNSDPDVENMAAHAAKASEFLRSLSHPHRLLILCQLSQGERSVGELADTLDVRQPTLSQHLARLRAEGLVSTRRDGNVIYYRLERRDMLPVIQALYQVFCGGNQH